MPLASVGEAIDLVLRRASLGRLPSDLIAAGLLGPRQGLGPVCRVLIQCEPSEGIVREVVDVLPRIGLREHQTIRCIGKAVAVRSGIRDGREVAVSVNG